MGGHATCAVQGAADDPLELLHGALAIVVDERVVELRRELQLALRNVEPLVDLALALGRPRAQAALAAGTRSRTASAPFVSISSTGERPSPAIRSSSDQSVPDR